VRTLCREQQVLMVADEIQSGLARTGRTFACDHEDVVPDMYILGKALGGGLYPVSAVAANRDVLGVITPGTHGSTFGGNPVACAASLATIDLLEGGLIANAAARGEQAVADLRRLADRYDGLVRDVRGKGLMLGVEFDTPEHAEEAQWACFERGLLVLECGVSSVRMSPALVVTEEQMATALRIFAEAVAEVAGDDAGVLDAASKAGAITGVEAAG
jgi:acetylornithine/succinyldiaminopimelate/putrescine aminotransferase